MVNKLQKYYNLLSYYLFFTYNKDIYVDFYTF